MNGLLAKEHSCGRTQRKFRHNKLVNSFVGSASAGGISFEHAGKRSGSARSAQIRFWRFARFDYGDCCRSARRVALRPRPTRRRLSRREAAVERCRRAGRLRLPRRRAGEVETRAARQEGSRSDGHGERERRRRIDAAPIDAHVDAQAFRTAAAAADFPERSGCTLRGSRRRDIGFVERLVWFWSNHFCISADKDIAMVGAYEREAIRAHVLGRFADMLIAVESHPAMLYYLDNVARWAPTRLRASTATKG